MTSTAAQMRAWTGPVLLSYGFRPFFLGAGAWAVLAMGIWVLSLTDVLTIPTAFDPVSWHAHEILFGYLGAVVSGFLLTTVPNWTGRLPVVGWPLAGLAMLWIAGRVVVMFSAYFPPLLVAIVDLSGLTLLALYLGREIIAGRKWHNLAVVTMLSVLIVANGLFHWQAATGNYAAGGSGLRLGLAAAIMLIVQVGGRIIPSFTRNWLAQSGSARRPARTGATDHVASVAMIPALVLWVTAPTWQITAWALSLAGAIHLLRLFRWRGLQTGAEPLVWILHAGYSFVPLGAIAIAASILFPTRLSAIAAQHLWMAGAIGTMTLAVMTRATLGHTGQKLSAGISTLLLYLAVLGAVLCRYFAGFLPSAASVMYDLSGLLWCAGFSGFTLIYGRALLQRKPGKASPGNPAR